MLHAYIDESGITPHGERTSEHFVLSAVVLDESNYPKADAMLRHLRRNTGAQRERPKIHFNDIANHGARRYMSHVLGTRPWLSIVSVVVCKRHLAATESALIQDVPAQYNHTFRYLLERLSWLARAKRTSLKYTASRLGSVPPESLAEYETVLRAMGDRTEIKWECLDSPAGLMVPADEVRRLDLADIAASATARAFEPDDWGMTEPAYLRNLAPALFRSQTGNVARYGIKIHPTAAEDQAEYAWIRALSSEPGETISLRPEPVD